MLNKLKSKAKSLSDKVEQDLNKAKNLANEKFEQGSKLASDIKKDSLEIRENLSKSSKAALDAANVQKEKLNKKFDEQIAKMSDKK